MPIFTGCGTAMITPFTDTGEVNYEKFEELIDFQLDNGVRAIVVCGSTGESATLTDDEKRELISLAVTRVRGRAEVIAGTGTNDTEHAVKLTKAAKSCGADGCLMVTPYYNKTSPAGLVAHYSYIAKAVDIPILIYNVPARTGLNVTPAVNYELSKIPNVVGTKEASGNIVQVAETAAFCGDDFEIYAGNDDYILPVLSLGGVGVISTMANIIPKDTCDIVEKYLNCDHKEAQALQLKTLGLIRALFCEVNPVPVKEALNILGKAVGGYRLPLVGIGEKNRELLIAEMKAYGLLA